MPGKGAIAELVRLGASLESLVVPAVGKRPIPLELVATGVGGERPFDVCPRHVPMPIHVPIGHGVRDTLVAKLAHQPIENSRSVMVLDCCKEASVDCVMPEIVDAGNLTGNVAYPPNNGSGVLHPLGLAGNGEPACHVKSTPPTGVARRYRRRCTAGSFEWIGDRQEFERHGANRLPYERGGQRG